MFKATEARRQVFDKLFGFQQVVDLAQSSSDKGAGGHLGLLAGGAPGRHSCGAHAGTPLEFGVDVNAARYLDGKRETAGDKVAVSGAAWCWPVGSAVCCAPVNPEGLCGLSTSPSSSRATAGGRRPLPAHTV